MQCCLGFEVRIVGYKVLFDQFFVVEVFVCFNLVGEGSWEDNFCFVGKFEVDGGVIFGQVFCDEFISVLVQVIVGFVVGEVVWVSIDKREERFVWMEKVCICKDYKCCLEVEII